MLYLVYSVLLESPGHVAVPAFVAEFGFLHIEVYTVKRAEPAALGQCLVGDTDPVVGPAVDLVPLLLPQAHMADQEFAHKSASIAESIYSSSRTNTRHPSGERPGCH